jgi:hypothetical protein
MIRVRLDLAAQARHQHVDAAIVGLGAAARHHEAELIARQHPARLAAERQQQGKLRACELHLLPARIDAGVSAGIEREALEHKQLRECLVPARRRAQRGLDPGQHILLAQSGRSIFRDDDHLRDLTAELACQLDASQPVRHHNGQGDPLIGDDLAGAHRGLGELHRITRRHQPAGQHGPLRGIARDNQDTWFHHARARVPPAAAQSANPLTLTEPQAWNPSRRLCRAVRSTGRMPRVGPVNGR